MAEREVNEMLTITIDTRTRGFLLTGLHCAGIEGQLDRFDLAYAHSMLLGEPLPDFPWMVEHRPGELASDEGHAAELHLAMSYGYDPERAWESIYGGWGSPNWRKMFPRGGYGERTSYGGTGAMYDRIPVLEDDDDDVD